jgi:hypothetical protein
MMGKALSLLLVLMVFTANANASNSVKLVFDSVKYKIDQLDPKSETYQADYSEQMKLVKDEILRLQTSGVTNQEIFGALNASFLNKNNQFDYQQLLALVDAKELSREEMNNLIFKHLQQNYAQGANWHYIDWNAVLTASVIIGFFTFVIIMCATRGCDTGGGDSSGGGGGGSGWDYGDDWYEEDCYYDWDWEEWYCY